MKVCAYCGETRRPLTQDHIPQRAFFPRPRASNLITVPCCELCREGWSQDDEYFKAAVINSERVFGDQQAQRAMEPFLRSLRRPEKRGFLKMLDKSLTEVGIESPAGVYLGQRPALKLDKDRIDRVSARIVRGFFFHEKGYPVPKHYEVLGRLQQFGIDPLLDDLKNVEFPAVKVVQDGVFSYTFRSSEEDHDSTVLLALFYRRLHFVGFTRLPAALRDRRFQP